ncbi:MAG: hypothetical protein AB7T06_07310 [Kofleriaceae bacterium]
MSVSFFGGGVVVGLSASFFGCGVAAGFFAGFLGVVFAGFAGSLDDVVGVGFVVGSGVAGALPCPE